MTNPTFLQLNCVLYFRWAVEIKGNCSFHSILQNKHSAFIHCTKIDKFQGQQQLFLDSKFLTLSSLSDHDNKNIQPLQKINNSGLELFVSSSDMPFKNF